MRLHSDTLIRFGDLIRIGMPIVTDVQSGLKKNLSSTEKGKKKTYHVGNVEAFQGLP